MQWFNDFQDWFTSTNGQSVVAGTILPCLAILIAGIVAALIGRGATRRLITLTRTETRVAAVAAIIGSARRASVWNTLSAAEQQHADHVASEADVRLRLLAVPGSRMAAEWAEHEIIRMKRNSVIFSAQAEGFLSEIRERMVLWQARPRRAKRLFKEDLDAWVAESATQRSDLAAQQNAWEASQLGAPATASSSASPAVVPFTVPVTSGSGTNRLRPDERGGAGSVDSGNTSPAADLRQTGPVPAMQEP